MQLLGSLFSGGGGGLEGSEGRTSKPEMGLQDMCVRHYW